MFARILKYCDLSWPALTQLKQWMKRSASFNSFDVETFAATSLRVASATNEKGEVVCYTPIETVFMVSAYAVNPTATPAEAQRGGDVIDAAVAHQAQLAGVSKLLLVVPANHPDLPEGEWKQVRVFERKIPQNAMLGIGNYSQAPAVQYLN